ncbi:MAG: peptide chain release factor-like protein [Planctomycetes bacterium]|nr:peptide chain release factor-like protein [Planctomycetota bacterium]
MKYPADAPVTPFKHKALQERIARLGIPLGEIEEHFVRAGGPGGQKVNKTSSGVQLQLSSRELTVKWTHERSRALNRFLALRELVDRIEQLDAPQDSARLAEHARIRKQKARRRRRHAGAGP